LFKKNDYISVVVPVFNNAESLSELNDRICKTLSQIKFIKGSEIIYTNDGSTDNSHKQLLLIKKNNESKVKIRVIDLMGNHGQQNATFAGLFNASGNVMITLSADLQDPPEIISRMYSTYKKNNSIVVAIRSKRNDSLIRKIGSRIVYGLANRSNPEIPKFGFDIIMFEKKVMEFIFSKKQILALSQLHIIETGLPISYIDYEPQKRKYGKSEWNIKRLVSASSEILNYYLISFARHSIYLGTFFIILSITIFCLILIGYVSGELPFQGFALIAGLIIFFGGFIMSTVGAIFVLVSKQYYKKLPKNSFLIRSIS